MNNTASNIDQIDPNATSATSREYLVNETIFGRQVVNEDEPVWIVAIGVRGHLFVQYHHGQRRWIHTTTAGVKYRRASASDVIPQWVHKAAPIPPEPTGNPFLDNARRRPGQAKTKVPGVNDERPVTPRAQLVPPDAPVVGYTEATAAPRAPVQPPVTPRHHQQESAGFAGGDPGKTGSSPPASSPAPKAPPAVIDAEMIDDEMVVAPQGMALVRVEGMPLAVTPGDPEQRALAMDLTIGEMLRLSRPRDIRKTIIELENAGRLGKVDWRDQRSRQLVNGGGTRTFVTRVAWLDEAQALKVILRSNTDIAHQIADRVIQVFIAWRKGQPLAAPVASNPALDLMREQMAMMAQTQQTITQTMNMLAAVVQGTSRPADPVDLEARQALREKEEKGRKEQLRKRQEGEFQALLPTLKTIFRPLLTEFLGAMFEVVDIQKKENRSRCLNSGRIEALFKDWLRARNAKDLPDQRVTFSLLKELTDGVRIEGKTIEGKKKLVILPFALKA